jgi:hypothetical protein
MMLMNSYRYRISKEDEQRTDIWDAFVDFLETTYFPGAAELLNTSLIAFEYDAFKNCYAN